MPRLHLFELEDQTWFPSLLRDYATDFLQFLSNKTRIYRPVVPILENMIRKSGHKKIIDLASGGGGGMIWLNGELTRTVPELEIVLTDLFPNLPAFRRSSGICPNFSFIETSVDARDVPPDLAGIRTMFLSFHHFRSDDARSILTNAVDNNMPIGIFDGPDRSIPGVIGILFSPVTVLLTTPFIRPFTIGRIFFTYLLPLVPLTVLWDGLVSTLRTYSVAELNSMLDQVKNRDRFDWSVSRLKSGPGVILCLTGIPKKGGAS